MKRDKTISVRVNSHLLNKVLTIINKRTIVTKTPSRTYYNYISENGSTFKKYTISDLIEKVMTDYLNKFSEE